MKKILVSTTIVLMSIGGQVSALDCAAVTQAIQNEQNNARRVAIDNISKRYQEIATVSDSIKSVCMDNLTSISVQPGLPARIAIRVANKLCDTAAAKAMDQLAKARGIINSKIPNLDGLNNVINNPGQVIENVVDNTTNQVINQIPNPGMPSLPPPQNIKQPPAPPAPPQEKTWMQKFKSLWGN